MTNPEPKFVSRGGLKLLHALQTFKLDVTGFTCADFGCNVGGFTDCLLQHGASKVFAIDTGYGELAWTLRNDPRVIVMERTNALHADPPDAPERLDLITIDMAWTPQEKCIPAAIRWLKPDPERARIITLIKPHYEARVFGMEDRLQDGVLSETDAELILARVLEAIPSYGATVLAHTRSPIEGGAGKKNRKGNIEFLALLAPRMT